MNLLHEIFKIKKTKAHLEGSIRIHGQIVTAE